MDTHSNQPGVQTGNGCVSTIPQARRPPAPTLLWPPPASPSSPQPSRRSHDPGKILLDPGEEAGADSGSISGPDGGAGAGAIKDAGAGPAVGAAGAVGAAADTSSPCGSPVGTVAIQNVLMVPGPERKGDPGPGVAEIPVLIPGQQLRLDVVPAPPANQSFFPDIHLGPHLGPGMFLGHFHIHRLESIIHSLQEVSLPFPGVPVLVLRWETAGSVPRLPHNYNSGSTCCLPHPPMRFRK